MFTGIVRAVGHVERVVPSGDGIRIHVAPGSLDTEDIAVGDSVAVSGCCLTVVERTPDRLSFDVSAETLRRTTGLDVPGDVNLEKSLRPSDRMGGHLVLGHVDGTGIVLAFHSVDVRMGGSVELRVEAPLELARFIASKGSICVDGVSLTVNDVEGRRFSVNLIPHTLAVTTLGKLAVQARVNLEVDVVARYVARLREFEA